MIDDGQEQEQEQEQAERSSSAFSLVAEAPISRARARQERLSRRWKTTTCLRKSLPSTGLANPRLRPPCRPPRPTARRLSAAPLASTISATDLSLRLSPLLSLLSLLALLAFLLLLAQNSHRFIADQPWNDQLNGGQLWVKIGPDGGMLSHYLSCIIATRNQLKQLLAVVTNSLASAEDWERLKVAIE